MPRIPLWAKGKRIVGHALVDDADYALAASRRWNRSPDGYAFTSETLNGRMRIVRMHRLIMGLGHGDPLTVDHINRDKVDNRRENLRVITLGQQAQNVSSRPGSSSQYRGVYWHSQRGKWAAHTKYQGHKIHVGLFEDEEEAARAVAKVRCELFPFATERLT